MINLKWNVGVIEDTESGEYSLECLCGGIGLNDRRLILIQDEIEAIKNGTMEYYQIIRNICQEDDSIKEGLAEHLSFTSRNQKDSL